MDYSIYDAIQAGFGKIVWVIRKDFEEQFRTQILSKYEGKVKCELCFQALDALPEGFSVPEGRQKPWGTNHAVLMGKDVIKEPFCVINCDDFYNAFMVIGKYLANLPEGARNQYAMVGFRVGNTLSENGTVARGICSKNAQGHLTTVVERTEIVRCAADGNGTVARGICSKNAQGHLTTVVERTEIVRCAADGSNAGAATEPIRYKDENGQWVEVADNTPVSMNMWGFTPDYFEYSEAEFKTFLSDPKNMENLKAEFFIPLMEVLDTTSKWFGVTYAADRDTTVARIQQLVDEGVYPNKLF